MTNEEMIARARAGDADMFEKFFAKNENFPFYIARKFQNTGLDVEDLASIANVGMMKAYHSFDLNKAIKFATYAARCMSNEILMFLRRNNKHIGVASLDAALNIDFDGNELTLADVMEDTSARAPDSNVMSLALVSVTQSFLGTLPERNQKIFLSCVVEEKKQEDVASELGISQSYVSRLTKRLIKKFQKYAHEVGFVDGRESTRIQKVIKVDAKGDDMMQEKKKRRKLTRELYDSMVAKGMNDAAIARELDYNQATIVYYRKKWEEEDKLAVKSTEEKLVGAESEGEKKEVKAESDAVDNVAVLPEEDEKQAEQVEDKEVTKPEEGDSTVTKQENTGLLQKLLDGEEVELSEAVANRLCFALQALKIRYSKEKTVTVKVKLK